MVCPKCSSVNAGGAKFCNECGTNISVLSHESAAEQNAAGAGRPRRAEQGGLSIGDANTFIRAGHQAEPKAQESGTPLDARYTFLGEIGRGGFAVVTKARDKKLGRIVAIKRLLSEQLSGRHGEQIVERFRREAQSIAKLNHLNIVTVYDHDCDKDGYYIVMEYVDGGSLKDLLKARGGKLPVATALRLVRGVAQGLAYAHRMNLVHRDIKPGNILLSRGAAGGDGGEDGALIPKLVDFGLARAGAESDMSLSGFGMGTPFYAAPEQRRDAKNVNHTADIYSLGKMLYEMVTGEIPDTVDPEVIPPPPELAKIIIKCLKPNPGDRYFSADELIAALTLLEGKKSSVAAVAGGKAGGSDDACPACGMVNVKDSRFCQGCGTGLYRPCPECGRELPVQAPYCGACGTDVAAFLHVQDIADRIGRYRDEKKHTRVLKEFEQLPGTGFVPRGPKAAALVGEAQEAQAEAAEVEAKKKTLANAIDEARKQEDCDRIEVLLRQYKEVNGTLEEEMNRLRDRVPVVRQIQVLKQHVAELKGVIDQRNWTKAQELFREKPSVPEAVEAEDEAQIAAYLAQVSSLYARMSAVLASNHGQLLKQLRAEILAAQENGEWDRAWQLTHTLPAFPEMLLAEHRATLSEQSAEIQSHAAVIAQGWIRDLSDKAFQSARQGEWDEAYHVLEVIEELPLDQNVLTECYGRVEEQLNEIHVSQLRRKMREATEARQWEDAQTAASALEKLAPGDGEARQVIAEGMQGKRRDQTVAEILSLFNKGVFQKCTVLCDGLIQEAGPSFDLTGAGFTGVLGELRDQAAERAVEQAARIVTMNSALVKHDWDSAMRQASDLLKEYGWMSEAKDALRRASAGKRRARLKRTAVGAAATVIVMATGWGTYRVAGYLRVRSDFYAAVRRGDEVKASQLAEVFSPRYIPVQSYQKCLSLRAAAGEQRRLAILEGCDTAGSACWSEAEARAQSADKRLKEGQFEQAEKDFAAAAERYPVAVAWGRKNKVAADLLRQEVQAYEDILQQQDKAGLGQHGGPAWVEAQRFALQGREPQTDPAKLEACAEAMRKASKELLTAVAHVKREETRIAKEQEAAAERLQAARKKSEEAYQAELLKQNPEVLKAYSDDLWQEALRLAGQGDRATDAEEGRKAYEAALAKLQTAAAFAQKRWAEMKDEALKKYGKVKNECQALLEKAQQKALPDRSGYEAAVECQRVLSDAEKAKIFVAITADEAEQAFIDKMRADVKKRVESFYRGPNPQEQRWVVPELGLVFVWVPVLDAWVGQTEVPNGAFRRFSPQHASGASDSASLDGAEQPAVQITFKDAAGFAARLTEQEGKANRIPTGYTYRLLAGSEWTLCVQCGNVRRYPWGNSWPPKYGNYGDASRRRLLGHGLEDYDDRFLVSAPVGSNGTNEWGLCDLGGDVREWTCGAN